MSVTLKSDVSSHLYIIAQTFARVACRNSSALNTLSVEKAWDSAATCELLGAQIETDTKWRTADLGLSPTDSLGRYQAPARSSFRVSTARVSTPDTDNNRASNSSTLFVIVIQYGENSSRVCRFFDNYYIYIT